MPKNFVSYESEIRIKWSSCSFKWTINEVSKLLLSSRGIMSENFSSESNDVFGLQLNEAFELHWIYLFLISSPSSITLVEGSFSLINNGIKEKGEVIQSEIREYNNPILDTCINLKEFLKRQERDQFTIICEVSVGYQQTDLVRLSPVWGKIYQQGSLNQKFEKFQGNQFLTDVELEVSGKTFKGHKLILAAVSPVFEKMFQGNSQEHQNNRVIIEDVDADVFEELMTYIYSGQLPHLKEMVSDLLAVADKYSILPLLQICMNDLLENMSVDDAAATYVLADRHSLHQVKPVIIHFMKKHFYDVATSAGWQSLVNNYPQLTKEIRDKISENSV